jgi:hypothetical protein
MKFFRGFNVLLVILSVVFVALGIINLLKTKTEAADQAYSETYEVTKWRNATTYAPAVSIGPAEWSVKGDNGTMSFSEKWTVTSWNDNAGLFKTGGVYNGLATFSTSDSKNPSCTRFADSYISCVSGTYGGTLWQPMSSVTSLGFMTSFSSIPEKWKIEGTMSTK